MNKVDRIHHMLLSETNGFTNLIDKQAYVYVQPKVDGFRALGNVNEKCLYSRQLNDFKLSHIVDDLNRLPVNMLPDGELYCHGKTLPEIQSMIRRGDKRIQLHVFDMVSDLPFSARHKELTRSVNETASIKIIPTLKIRPDQIEEQYNSYLALGFEGMVIRLDGYGYEQGRSETIFKKKPIVVNRIASMFI